MNNEMTSSKAGQYNDVSAGDPLSNDIARDFEYEDKKPSPYWQLIRDVGETIILTLIMFLVIRLAVQDYQVDGMSMVPTLQDRQFVLVDKLSYSFGAPQRGDVIVFEYPKDHTQNYIKRIIGLPGDNVYVSPEGRVSVNGIVLTEPYISGYANPYPDHQPWVVAPDTYFVLGDNRGASSDSREWGLVNRSEIIGKASLIYWPLAAVHFLPDEQGVYSSVPPGKSLSSSLPDATHPVNDVSLVSIMVLVPFGVFARRRVKQIAAKH
jgi:signal peptidase I